MSYRICKNESLKTKRGSMLVYALVIMTVVSILLTSIVGFVVEHLKFSSNRVSREEAFQVAEAGIYYYRWYLAHATDGMNAQQLKAFWQATSTLGVSGPVVRDYIDPETGDIVGSYTLTLDPPDPSSTIARITSVGVVTSDSGVSRTIRARFRRPSWSEYIALADDFMRFGEGTEVFGKIHSNKGVRFDGLAHNSVTSLIPSVNDPDHTGSNEFGVHTHVNAPPGNGINNNFRPSEAAMVSPIPNRPDVFEGGRQFPVPEVSFTGVQSDLDYMKKMACDYNEATNSCAIINGCGAHGCYFDNAKSGRQIILKSDGTFRVCSVETYDSITNSMTGFSGRKTSATNGDICVAPVTTSGPNTQCKDKTTGQKCYCTCSHSSFSYSIPNDGIIYVDNNVWLEGTLPLSTVRTSIIAGNGTMYLGNNDIRYSTMNGSNILGIIGKQNVEIIKNSQSTLQIDGAFLAQNGRVGRSDYGMSDYKSKITVNGAISTKQRYGFSWTNGGDNWGYDERNLNFDNNLLYFPPPYFPTGTEYSIDLWEEL